MGGVAVDTSPPLVPPPDGGWGWIVLLGGFVITGFSYAFPKAISVFFKELIDEFDVGYSDTAWLSSILLAMLYGSGPLSSVLVNRFGCRPVMIGGGLLASSGMIIASFCTSIIQLYLTAGVITGMGLALSFQPSLIMLGRYFDKRRPLANGLAAAGSPVFLTALSPFNQYLVHEYAWRGGFLIIGGLLLNCCVCGAVMRPLKPSKQQRVQRELEEMLPGKKKGEFVAVPLDDKPQIPGSPPPRMDSPNDTKVVRPEPKRKLLDFTVFQDKGFVIYTVAAAIMVIGLFVPPIFVVSYAKDMGVEDTKAAFLLSVVGIIDIFARPTCGLMAGLPRIRPIVVYVFSFAMFFNGFADLMCTLASDYQGLAVFCFFFGVSYGMVGALQFEVLMNIVGQNVFPSAIGLVLLIEAATVLIGAPTAGFLRDYMNSYKPIFILAGSMVLLSSLVLSLCNFFCLKTLAKPPTQTKNTEMVELPIESNSARNGPASNEANQDSSVLSVHKVEPGLSPVAEAVVEGEGHEYENSKDFTHPGQTQPSEDCSTSVIETGMESAAKVEVCA
uniref:Solute carrier family 16 member 3 n=1 Tax=Eptatretus burgeri TaxID=7764 RepID=A0A8C4Q0R1_EPTBU